MCLGYFKPPGERNGPKQGGATIGGALSVLLWRSTFRRTPSPRGGPLTAAARRDK